MEGQRPCIFVLQGWTVLLRKHFHPKILKNIFLFVSRCIFHFSILYKNKVILLAEIRAKNSHFPLDNPYFAAVMPESVMEQAVQDGEALCFTDPVPRHCCRRLLEQELVTDPKAAARLEAIRQLDDVSYDTGFEPPISDLELDGLDLER